MHRPSILVVVAMLALPALVAAEHVVCPDGEAELSGMVLSEATGEPLGEVTSVGIESTDGTYSDGEAALPDTGEWVTCVPVGKSYIIGFFADSFELEFWEDAATVEDATPVAVNGPVTGLTAYLSAACEDGTHRLAGQVVDEQTGEPLFGSVGIEQTNGDYSDGEVAWPGTGRFETCVPRGNYILHFFVDDYVPEFWEDAHTERDATVVRVHGSVDDIVARLSQQPPSSQALLVGRVVSHRGGAPLFASIHVEQVGGLADGEANDPETGAFSLAVDPGTYLLRFDADGHWSEWYDNANRRSRAVEIVVSAGDVFDLGTIAMRPCRLAVFCIPRNIND